MRTSNAVRRVLRLSAPAVACALAFAAPSAAQDIARPHLDGHTFLSTDLVPDAFVRTNLRNSLGYAQALDVEYPSVVIDGDTLIALDGSLVYAVLDFDVEYAVKEWVSLRARINARTRVGTDVPSILLDGLTVGTILDLGWKFRVRETTSTSLVASAGFMNGTFTRIDIEGFVEDVVNDVPDPSLIDDIPVTRAKGGLHYAWAISRPVGLTLMAEGSYGDTPWRDVDEGWEYSYGAAVDVDGKPLAGVPLGVGLGFRQTSLPELSATSANVARSAVVRVAFNAQPDFLVGVDLTMNRTKEIDGRDPISAGGVSLTLKYWF